MPDRVAQPPGPNLVGERLSIRLRDPEGGFRDIVGILESETNLRKRDGTLVEFSPDRVAVWRKVVPALQTAGKGAPLSLRIREMELAAAQTWPPRIEEHLGEWTLRASGKYTMRANSVLVMGDPGIDLDSALDSVVTFYKSHGLSPAMHVPLPTYQDLDGALASRGWSKTTEAWVMVKDIEDSIIEEILGNVWSISSSFDDEWLTLQNDSGVAEIMRSFPAHYASLKIKGDLVALGRAANCEDWTVLTRLFVRPDHRGASIGRELVQRLLRAARESGATKALLQVDSKNAAAIRVYESLGFRKHHAYCYRVLQDNPKGQDLNGGNC